MALPELLNGLGQTVDGQSGLIPPPTPFTGIHYSQKPIKGKVLHGEKRGLSGEGEDSDRVYLPPRGAPAGVHVYESNGQVYGKHPSILARPNPYTVSGNFSLADIATEPLWSQAKSEVEQNLQGKMDPAQTELIARNEAEWRLKEAGFHGYRNSATSPGSVFLFGDVPATPLEQSTESTPQSAPAPGPGPDPAAPITSAPGPFSLPFAVPSAGPHSHEAHPADSDPARLQTKV